MYVLYVCMYTVRLISQNICTSYSTFGKTKVITLVRVIPELVDIVSLVISLVDSFLLSKVSFVMSCVPEQTQCFL